MSAYNHVGQGLPSDVVTARTLGHLGGVRQHANSRGPSWFSKERLGFLQKILFEHGLKVKCVIAINVYKSKLIDQINYNLLDVNPILRIR